MSRHRSPSGRRAHLGPPLFAVAAAAGVGGARSIPLPQPTSLPTRFVATVLAGGALAAAGQHALTGALPAIDDGANVLRLGVTELLGTADPSAALVAATTVASAPLTAITPEPSVVDAADLVKAADLQLAAAQAAAAAEKVRAAETARTAKAARTAASTITRGLQMTVGRITSGFGGRWGSFHEGLDIAAPIGTPIHVPLAGTVIDSGAATGFGLWVRVRHTDGTITVYGHVNRSLVRVGQKVAAGQEIAEVGNRGHSTGPHLHFEVITPAGHKINPRPWLDARGIGVT